MQNSVGVKDLSEEDDMDGNSHSAVHKSFFSQLCQARQARER